MVEKTNLNLDSPLTLRKFFIFFTTLQLSEIPYRGLQSRTPSAEPKHEIEERENVGVDLRATFYIFKPLTIIYP